MEDLPSSTYVYQTLLPGEIRLLTLLPGEIGQPIRCDLNVITLPEKFETEGLATSYQALSYMWDALSLGDTKISEPGYVRIGNASLSTRSNLLQALKNLRYTHYPRYLWIDAICIDQSSTLERNHQVSRMRHIYRQASAVLMWLCDEDMDPSSRWNQRWDKPSIAQIMSIKSPTLTATGKIIHFCCAPYWSRLWIIQELLSARRLVLYCGTHRCKWRYLADSLTTIAAQQKVETGVPPLAKTPIWVLLKSLQEKETSLTLRQLLLRHGESKCQDPRDHIFGLLGLASDCQNGEISIDYAMSTKELFDRVITLYADCNHSELIRFTFHLRNILL